MWPGSSRWATRTPWGWPPDDGCDGRRLQLVTRLDRLWSGWRTEYLSQLHEPEGEAVVGSVFTRILGSGLPDEETHVVHRGAQVFAIMNLYPYSVGHLMVLPYREVGDLVDLTGEESAELWATVTDAVRAVRAGLRPGGVNVGVNLGRPAGGSIREHLHVHVVPRWVGDGNFMTATADTRLLPEALPVTAAKLRDAWPSSAA